MIEIPDTLIQEIKCRAARDGRDLNDEVAELLRRGLEAGSQVKSVTTAPRITRDTKTGLPVVHCTRAALPGEELTPTYVADILLEQEAEWHCATG